ncbi:TIGR02328 family protein [Leuconostoc fallax]|uniref:TIGR02328 family protein n=1 Tax=Leuconostoc fallax TaxID=1251 RepID=UPI002091280F|nr:TIGR02328 family protein [Leuconostoc fallax]MCO6183613.1 TIGR02328 family protein [Leuconostoc fallax]
MRLWHQKLIARLPRQQLLGQHRECCALRGKGWQRPHQTVNYVFNYSPYKLFQYHYLVMAEMIKRGYHPDMKWFDPCYRGQYMTAYPILAQVNITAPIYPEHNTQYYHACLDNLKRKNIII